MLRAIDKWLPAYLLRRRPPRGRRPPHVVITVCDHFEPFHHADKPRALERLERWASAFPTLTSEFRDSGGHPPKHTFFYPIEQYDRDVVGRLADLCHATRSETEIHLHHDGDDANSLRESLELGKSNLASHGLLAPHPSTGGRAFGFIHGDWALDNSHPEGRHCGVSGELAVLREAGCFADFTMPSAPSPTQTRTINSIYYATSTPQPKSHDRGEPAGPHTATLRHQSDRLLLVQGPLALNWRWRKLGVLPRVENADLTGANPPTPGRLRLWCDLGIHVRSRPDVTFVKLHTHGAIERNSAMLLGAPMRAFHRALADSGLTFHYATAREMVNIIHALEDGATATPDQLRDHHFPPPR